jgi:hypothetical protein
MASGFGTPRKLQIVRGAAAVWASAVDPKSQPSESKTAKTTTHARTRGASDLLPAWRSPAGDRIRLESPAPTQLQPGNALAGWSDTSIRMIYRREARVT